LAAPSRSLDRLGWGIEWGQPAAYPGGAEFGVEFGDCVGDLFTGGVVTDSSAFGVDREEIGPDGHQLLLIDSGLGPFDDGLSFEVPALAALGHP
jgi:hypothetical protein